MLFKKINNIIFSNKVHTYGSFGAQSFSYLLIPFLEQLQVALGCACHRPFTHVFFFPPPDFEAHAHIWC